ncbi:MAG: zinc ABC transporter substrate-binding protein [Peptoniphilaceae bacterium]|nr:zinc ABC transporter substrate-binding protein [Peptoniphilaceae bacterium]
MKTQKKILTVSLALALFLTACGTNGANESASADATSQETAMASNEAQTSEEAAKDKSLVIYASTDPIYDFVTMIGQDRVEVVDLMEGEGDAHNWEPSPQLLKDINRADLFLVNGANLEHWLPDIQGAVDGDVQFLDMSAGVNLITNVAEDHEHEEAHEAEHEEEHEDAHEHDHGGVDPHYWLNPKDAAIQAKNVHDALVKADPEGQSVYDEGYAKVEEEFQKLVAAYDAQLTPFVGRSVIVPHEAFSYLFNEYQLTQVGIEGLLAEGQPDAKTVAHIVDLGKKNQIQTVFYEGYGDPSQAEAIAKEIGADTAPLYTLEAESKEDRANGANYFTFMMQNLESLVKSFGA